MAHDLAGHLCYAMLMAVTPLAAQARHPLLADDLAGHLSSAALMAVTPLAAHAGVDISCWLMPWQDTCALRIKLIAVTPLAAGS